MKVLVIGGGGREHALAWKLAQSERISRVYVAPGNAGTALDPDMVNVPITKVQELVEFAEKEHIGLTIVGPEAPLSQGVVDAFRAAKLKIFGPTQAAAQLESSKDFAKAFMVRHNIPTAAYATFTDAVAAHDYVKQQGAPIVIKADGLAAGKGVVVAMTETEAHEAIDAMLADNKLGAAGARVVIEEFLTGEEASFIVMVDGKNILALATSQDHKRLLDGDQGPNTGGMGAYSPAPVVTPDIHAKVMREIITPTVEGMAKDGIPYTGFLYAGLMISQMATSRRWNSIAAWVIRKPSPLCCASRVIWSPWPSMRSMAHSMKHRQTGTGAVRWAWCWPRPTTLTPHAWVMKSQVYRKIWKTRMCSMRAPP